MAAIMSRRRSWRSTPAASSSPCGSKPSPIWGPISRPSPRRCRAISTARCWPASTRPAASTATSRRSLPTPRRSMPIAAPGGRKQPMSSNGWSRRRRTRPAGIRPNCAGSTSYPAMPSPTRRRSSCSTIAAISPVRWTRRWILPATAVSRPARRNRRPTASCAASASPPTSRRAALRHRRRSALWAPVWVSGNRQVSVLIQRVTSSCSQAATPTVRATKRPMPRSSRTSSACPTTRSTSFTAIPPRRRSAWAPTVPVRPPSAVRPL